MTREMQRRAAKPSFNGKSTRLATRAGASRWVAVLVGVVLGVGSLSISAPAMAGSVLHEVTWAHESPSSVARFVVFVAGQKGDMSGAVQVNVGKPLDPQALGAVFVYSAMIAADPTDYIAVAAVGPDGAISPLSIWTGLPPSTPGQPVLIP